MIRLSKSQVAFLDHWVPTQQIWAHSCDMPIGSVAEPAQRRTFEALIRKDVITRNGQVTMCGLKAWKRATGQDLFV